MCNIWMSTLPTMSFASSASGNCRLCSESRTGAESLCTGAEALCTEMLVCSVLSFVTDWRIVEFRRNAGSAKLTS